MADKFTEYSLPQTAYVAFDAESLRDLIIERLNEQGTFTDQIYQGSNMSSFIDVIAYSYHVLLYYLNRTSTESQFSEATIYENVNRIVKMLNYNPLGYQTATLSFKAFATEDLVPGTYTIPRYTYVTSNDTTYSFDTDMSFTKTNNVDEPINVLGSRYLMYQGMWVELPEREILGQDFETIIITPGVENTKIDHFHVHVYIRDVNTNKWHQYTETSSLYLNGPDDRVFEKRFTENESYEIKFGNNITGARPTEGDVVQIYYLESKGEAGEVGANFLDDQKLVLYGTTKFTSIKSDIKPENINYVSFDNIETMYLTNDTPSTKVQQRESVEEIKRKAPLFVASQDRLVTIQEFENYMLKNFGNMLQSNKIVDNNTYLNGHFRYLHQDIGIDNPNLESRVMYNHYNMSTTTHFNNVYIYGVPKITTTTSTTVLTNFLTESQKELIVNSMRDKKMISHEIVMMDPVYIAVDFGTMTASEAPSIDIMNNTVLEIKKSESSLRDDSAIIQEVTNVFVNYFNNTNCELGMLVNLNNIGSALLEINGIESIFTSRTDIDLRSPGLSMSMWNPVYNTDMEITNQNVQLPYFKFPYLYDTFNLHKKIIIVE